MDLIPVSSPEPEDQPPSISTPGRALIEIEYVHRGFLQVYRLGVVLHDYDDNTSPFWINEGVGWEWWVNEHLDLDDEGFYVIEGIVGTWIKGDGWTTDDDERWEFGLVRRASPEEMQLMSLSGTS